MPASDGWCHASDEQTVVVILPHTVWRYDSPLQESAQPELCEYSARRHWVPEDKSALFWGVGRLVRFSRVSACSAMRFVVEGNRLPYVRAAVSLWRALGGSRWRARPLPCPWGSTAPVCEGGAARDYYCLDARCQLPFLPSVLTAGRTHRNDPDR